MQNNNPSRLMLYKWRSSTAQNNIYPDTLESPKNSDASLHLFTDFKNPNTKIRLPTLLFTFCPCRFLRFVVDGDRIAHRLRARRREVISLFGMDRRRYRRRVKIIIVFKYLIRTLSPSIFWSLALIVQLLICARTTNLA